MYSAVWWVHEQTAYTVFFLITLFEKIDLEL